MGLPPKSRKIEKKKQVLHALKRKSTWPKRNVTELILYNGAGEKRFRAEAKSKFFTGLDEFDRNSLWDLLGIIIDFGVFT